MKFAQPHYFLSQNVGGDKIYYVPPCPKVTRSVPGWPSNPSCKRRTGNASKMSTYFVYMPVSHTRSVSHKFSGSQPGRNSSLGRNFTLLLSCLFIVSAVLLFSRNQQWRYLFDDYIINDTYLDV